MEPDGGFDSFGVGEFHAVGGKQADEIVHVREGVVSPKKCIFV